MIDDDGAVTRTLLEEIRDNQQLQIQRQSEALELQRRQIALVERQFERSEKLQERAEQLQERNGQLMERGRKVFMIIIPLLFVLLVYVSWLLFF